MFDVFHRSDHLPARPKRVDEFGDEIDDPVRESLLSARDERTTERIRRWALDPFQLAPEIANELERARTDPENYLKIGHHCVGAGH